MSRSEIGTEVEGMSPAATSHHPDLEWTIEHGRLVRVVMRHRGDARQQILQAAPLQPHALWNRQVLFNGRGPGAVDIFRPGSGIWIGALAKARKEIELEMVVLVDEPRQQQMTGEVPHLAAG